jgi:hypothetical protein
VKRKNHQIKQWPNAPCGTPFESDHVARLNCVEKKRRAGLMPDSGNLRKRSFHKITFKCTHPGAVLYQNSARKTDKSKLSEMGTGPVGHDSQRREEVLPRTFTHEITEKLLSPLSRERQTNGLNKKSFREAKSRCPNKQVLDIQRFTYRNSLFVGYYQGKCSTRRRKTMPLSKILAKKSSGNDLSCPIGNMARQQQSSQTRSSDRGHQPVLKVTSPPP